MNTALMIRPLSKYKVNQQKTKNEGKKKGGGIIDCTAAGV